LALTLLSGQTLAYAPSACAAETDWHWLGGTVNNSDLCVCRKELAMAKLKVRPLGDKVLIKRLEAESKTAGGIVLPDTAKEKPKRGTVQAVGDGKLLDNGDRSKMQVSKGDEVLFSSYAGTEIKIDGEEFLIVEEGEILAVLS
jgi:chaperonin GroES